MSSSIQHYFHEIIEKQNELGYPFPAILKTPASKQNINVVEQELNLKFSNELIELYTFADGTMADEQTPLGKSGLIPIYSFLSLSDAVDYYKNYIDHQDLFKDWESGYTPGKKMFPFLENSAGDCYWVDLNESPHQNKVYWTNSLGESPDYLFESLTIFFRVIHECYQTDLFFLDDDGCLEMDDLDFGRIAEKHNPGLKYWPRLIAEG